jgi:hypothetical protein
MYVSSAILSSAKPRDEFGDEHAGSACPNP